ncbi:plasmid partitioning protein RepB [Neoaquamicrobium sediminum]|uniref:plasmid partitioning protein RepB n=1 Tax=Neoaquamicrobium sediminum TaxID=1849104 RepID=UPI001564BCCE|nr:plasmid partitioning protein RepB [Mesorhizobium sediminum]NRC57192.1 plasmid partitioning protein RepB [Mesorhizobium sediminum]
MGTSTSSLQATCHRRARQPGQRARPAPRAWGAGVIGAADRSISQIVEERDRLQALVAAGGGGAVDLDPNLVDPSPFDDRLPDDDETNYVQFRESIRTERQKVPIQVRSHPGAEGRFQIVYGRRRVRAARELGIAVKALIVEMSDRDLAVAQGIENGQRQDLTWIERALFAQTMDNGGIRPRDIQAALGIDDAELARMRSVYRTIPTDVIKLIGRAPKVGRPRWTAFAKAFSELPDGAVTLRKTLSPDRVSGLGSDERFARAVAAIATGETDLQTDEVALRTDDGTPLGRAIFSKNGIRLVVDKQRSAAFATFLRAELPALLAKFEAADEEQEHQARKTPVS